MSKFKNKKALALAISAAMAGVGIVGVAAACAPTKQKTKPTKGKNGSSSSLGNANPGASSGSNTNPGTGSAGTQGTIPTTPAAPVNPGSPTETNKPTTPESGSAGSQGSSQTAPAAPTNPGSSSNSGSKNPDSESTTQQTPGNSESNSKNSSGTNSNQQPSEEPKSNTESGTKNNPTNKLNSSSDDNQNKGTESTQGSKQEANKEKDTYAKVLESAETIRQELAKNDIYKSINDKFTIAINEAKDIVKSAPTTELYLNAKSKLEEAIKVVKNEQKQIDDLNTKKSNAKMQISNLKNLTNEQIIEFNTKVDKVTDVSKISNIDDIIKEAVDKDKKNLDWNNKLTPVSSEVKGGDRNYIYLYFKTSKDTYNKIKDKKFKMTIDIDGRFEQEDSAGAYGPENKPIYVLNKGEENGFVNLEMSTHSYFNASTGAPKGNYKIIKLWVDDGSQPINLLNHSTQPVKIDY